MKITTDSDVLEMRYLEMPPPTCTKPGCNSVLVIRHMDGWQCLNCMKIIYREQPVMKSDNPMRDGYHRGSKYCFCQAYSNLPTTTTSPQDLIRTTVPYSTSGYLLLSVSPITNFIVNCIILQAVIEVNRPSIPFDHSHRFPTTFRL